MRRREFLRYGLSFAGGAAGAGLLPAIAQTSSPGLAARLAAFARGIHGHVVTPADTAYGMVSQVVYATFAAVRPLAVVVVADEADVAATIAFAARRRSLSLLRMRRGEACDAPSAAIW